VPILLSPVALRLSLGYASRYFRRRQTLSRILALNTAVLRIVRHPGSGSGHPRGSVLAMGNFDGLHRGHAALIGQARDRARAAGVPAAVLTFEPHPRSVFAPGGEPFRLTPVRVKEREIARLGADLL